MKSDTLLSLTSSSRSSLGDYIGMESCCDLKEVEESFLSSWACSERRGEPDQYHQRRKTVKREFPPPIPLLSRTENLPSHMPWVLKRYYTSDGRLILREEKVRHHEFLRAHRSNGRLTLQLVPLDDNVLLPPFAPEKIENDDEEVHAETTEYIDEVVNEKKQESFHEEPMMMFEHSTVENSSTGLGTNGGKCFNFSKLVANSSCFLGIAVPAIRPIHS
ncbi:hypothetical protein SLE2022_116280 [Rubroshorea leprosula]